ncbi:hypothetical protein CSUI_006413 [Cystoisospora suis]|uniref:Uncharacterized protein n=1 Tax=Cystoisospora suis TaxID=483139 RepID=A0A2C6KGZ5_9APIC|nr:hypothetical protein CSUI_006413 [Cystoisospora suis]
MFIRLPDSRLPSLLSLRCRIPPVCRRIPEITGKSQIVPRLSQTHFQQQGRQSVFSGYDMCRR